MTADPEKDDTDPTLPAASPEVAGKRIQDDEENTGIAAGYTYLGQFIDHDITFDPASSLQQLNDPDALWGDGHSFLRQSPNCQPPSIRSMGDLIAFALA